MISINISELFWTVINFFLLLFLLRHFLFNPVIHMMEGRQAHIDEKLAEEQNARTQAEENERHLTEEKTASRAEAKQLLEQTKEEQEQLHNTALHDARAESVLLRKEGEAALQRKKEDASKELHEAAPELAELLAKHLLGDE